MTSSSLSARSIAATALLAAAAAAATLSAANRTRGYAPGSAAIDTLRVKLATRTEARTRRLTSSAVVSGYLSARGLPPVQGEFRLSDSGLVFHSVAGRVTRFPLVGPVRQAGGRQWRRPTVSLAYVDEHGSRPTYVFRIDAGVFETESPGALLDVAAHPEWLDNLVPSESADQRLVTGKDARAAWSTAREITSSPFADSLYKLFGRPIAPIGLIGPKGRSAGRLGEYIAVRDSLALDPARMSSREQLRHAMTHELGHRWQARAPRQIETLWLDVNPIRDPRRYGYGDKSEHQAEAIAFAVNFLQATAPVSQPAAAMTLLDHYEFLVPGTRTMVRYLALQSLYRKHPLRSVLTTGR